MDKSTPIAAALFDTIPRGKVGKRRGPSRTLLFDFARWLAHRILLTKLVELDGDVRPYLAALMVAALAWVGETLVIPKGMRISMMTREAFDNMLLKEGGRNYNNYGLVSR